VEAFEVRLKLKFMLEALDLLLLHYQHQKFITVFPSPPTGFGSLRYPQTAYVDPY
jgi:hypothetical protein